VHHWEKLARQRMPFAYQAGRVCGEGFWVLLSCRADDGVRNARLFLTEGERNCEAYRWTKYRTCGVLGCHADHPKIELKENGIPTDQKTESVPSSVCSR
jgi:hypothetical protein